MPGTTVEFPANGGTASGYLAVPPAEKGPGLVVLQEYWGLVPHITEVTDRFAAAGFTALAPDLFHGEKTTNPDAAAKLFMALNIARAGTELRGAADFLLAQKTVTSKRVGVVGFCMGGQLALFAGVEHPDRFAAVVDFYGIHPQVRIDATRVTVPVLGHFATRDRSIPADQVRALAKAVNDAGGSFVAHFYDAEHAFFNDARPKMYSKESAALAWERTVGFLKDKVR